MKQDIKIDKTGWKKYRFDEFAQNISQRVEPQQTDLRIYVGLEHLDPDNIHIRRFGTPKDVEGTKLKVFPGDVIFGKRRAYQRKAALADFEGICSAHAMVLRAKTAVIDERLFPFFFHSKDFQETAITISVGGLSPTINWKDLAKQEFLLPPKEAQARFAELLWAADEVVERNLDVKEQIEFAFSRKRIELLGNCINGRYFENTKNHIRISNILLNEKSNVGKVDTTEYLSKGEIPIIDQSINEIAGYSNRDELKYSGRLPVIIFGDHTINIKYIDYPFILGADGTKILRTDETFNCKYVYYCLKNLTLIPQGYRRHFSILKECNIPFLPIIEQCNIVKLLDMFESQIKKIEIFIQQSQHLKSALINQIF